MKTLPWILFVLSLLAAIYLFVLLLNAGVALDNARSQTSFLRERSNLALLIVRKEWIGENVEHLVELYKEFERQGVVVGIEKNNFKIGDIIFETKNNVVTELHYID